MRPIRIVALALIVSSCSSGTALTTTTTAPTTTSTAASTTTAATTTTAAPTTTTTETTTTTSTTTVTITIPPLPSTTYEAQDLTGVNTSPGLYTTVQDMSPWNGGEEWGNHDQLFVGGQQVGDWIEIPFAVTANGSYVIQVIFTGAPDFANVLVSFDGDNVMSVNLYRAEVTPTGAFNLGLFTLSNALLYPIRFTVQGKDAQSTGYKFGIDQIIVTGPGD